MAEIRFQRGEFIAFRAVTTFHLGDFEKDIQKDEVIEFDGSTLKMGPDTHQYSKLRGAISAGWLVPDSDEGGVYIPRPAGVEVRPAESRGANRGPARQVGVVADEERDVGTRSAVRENARKPQGERTPRVAATGVRAADKTSSYEVVREASSEGRVVARGRFSVPAGSAARDPENRVEIGSTKESDFKRSVGGQTEGKSIDKVVVHVASGDVDEAIVGDDLEELLPNAASSGRPGARVGSEDAEGPAETPAERAERLALAKAEADARRAERMRQAGKSAPKTEFGEEAKTGGTDGPAIRNTEARVSTTEREVDTSVKVSSGSSSVGMGEDGVVVGRVGQRAAPRPAPVEVEDAGEAVPPAAIIAAKIEMIQQFVPGFQWDMQAHWRTRVAKALEQKNNMQVLNAILSLEVESVRKHVMQGLYGG